MTSGESDQLFDEDDVSEHPEGEINFVKEDEEDQSLSDDAFRSPDEKKEEDEEGLQEVAVLKPKSGDEASRIHTEEKDE